jgi:hypothetical protein
VTSTTAVPLNVRTKILHTRILATLHPAISHNSALSRCRMAWRITIFWYLSAPMIARIACLMASVDSSPPTALPDASCCGQGVYKAVKLL